MATERDYRTEAKAARKAARDTLIAFREARRKSKTPAGQGETVDAEPQSTGSSITPESLFDMSPAPEAEVSEEPAPPADGDVGPSEETETVIIGDSESSDSEPDVSLSEEVPSESVPSEAEPVFASAEKSDDADLTIASPSLGDIRENTENVSSDCDLFKLPGAGAGIVWMFQQCGIHSLSDLAQADANKLTMQLGVVGHILNIQPWIAFARGSDV